MTLWCRASAPICQQLHRHGFVVQHTGASPLPLPLRSPVEPRHRQCPLLRRAVPKAYTALSPGHILWWTQPCVAALREEDRGRHSQVTFSLIIIERHTGSAPLCDISARDVKQGMHGLIALAVPESLRLLQRCSSGSCSTPQMMQLTPVMQWRWPPWSSRQRS